MIDKKASAICPGLFFMPKNELGRAGGGHVRRKEKEGLSKTRQSNIASAQKRGMNGRRDGQKSCAQTSSG